MEPALEVDREVVSLPAPSKAFRLLWGHEETRTGTEYRENPVSFTVAVFRVECAYPVGSRLWVAGGLHMNGQVCMGSEMDEVWPRRLTFPRLLDEDVQNVGKCGDTKPELEQHIFSVFLAGRVNGYDSAIGGSGSGPWKVVWVQYVCPDGMEHVTVPMPESWDSRVALGVMEHRQLTGPGA